MITVIASLVGFLSSLIPGILKLFQNYQDKQHQLNLAEYQLRAYDRGIDHEIDVFKNRADLDEAKNLYSTYKSNIKWVDMINATVRPVLAYSFFGLYAFIKYKQFVYLNAEDNIQYFVEYLWTIDDQAIFAGIISFYFGQRALMKRMSFTRFKK